MEDSLTCIDLFSGCGGLTLGAHNCGMQTSHAVDVDPILSSSFPVNFPEAVHHNLSVSDIDHDWIEQNILTPPDAVLGGPPCQAFSVMGRNSMTDPRRMLVREYFRVVSALRPRFFIFENVQGLMSKRHRHVLADGVAQLGKNWTILEPIILDASDFGAPTSRKRVFVFGFNIDRCKAPSLQQIIDNESADDVSVRDAISDLVNAKLHRTDEIGYVWSKYAKSSNLSSYAERMRSGLTEFTGNTITKHTENTIERFRKLKQGETDRIGRYPRLRWASKCPTLRAGTGNDKGSYQAVRPIHPTKHRVITPRECARLQGFPDWFQFHQTVWHSCRMIGNSVSPVIAEHLIRNILISLGHKVENVDKYNPAPSIYRDSASQAA